MNILVTGINGFVGKHLACELRVRGHKVYGTGREGKVTAQLQDWVSGYYRCDLTNPRDVANVPLDGLDAVISLAGLAKVGDSFKNAPVYERVNVIVMTLLAERLIDAGSKARFITISTGAVYDSNQPMPLTEYSEVTDKGSPYARSKLLMEEAANELLGRGLDCVIVRPFNHIGPGQEKGFLVPDMYAKINAALKTGEPIEVGNLKTRRDYSDVRDVVKAYTVLASARELNHRLYNVCSGQSIEGAKILGTMLELMKAIGKVEISVNPEFIRPNDPPNLFGSHDRLSSDTGWEPKIDFNTTLEDYIRSNN